MANILQLRRGTTAQNNAFTGSIAEVTVDTDRDSLRVHDGVTVGGKEIADLATAIPLLTDATTVNAADELIVRQSGVVKRATSTELLNGTGAVTATGSVTGRTLKDRFADTVNVKDFGAVGDGVADDRAAIQAAVDAAFARGGGTVYAPAGTYLMGSFQSGSPNYYTVRAKSGVSFIGDGPETIIKFPNNVVTASQGITFLYDHDNPINDVRYSNFTIDWNGQNNPNQDNPVGNTNRLGTNGGATNWHIDNVTFLNPSGHHNIFLGNGGTRNSITNTVHLNAGRAVSGNTLITDHSSIYVSMSHSVVANNVFYCANLNDTVATAMEIHGSNNTVSDNVVRGYNIAVIAGAAENLANEENNVFSNNVFNEVIEGFRLVSEFTHYNDNFVLADNIITVRAPSGTSGYGIRAVRFAPSPVSKSLHIRGNTIKFVSASPTLTQDHTGISIVDHERVYCQGNVVRGFTHEAFYFQPNSANGVEILVDGNTFVDNAFTSTANRKRQIAMTTSNQLTAMIVRNNRIECGAATGTAASWGLQTFGDVQRLEVTDNTITGAAIASIDRNTDHSSPVVTLIKHTGAENPFGLIRATFGSEYRSSTSTRVWRANTAAQYGTTGVWQSEEWRTAPPTSGTYQVGDLVWNISPSVGDPVLWVCIQFGSPTFGTNGGVWQNVVDRSISGSATYDPPNLIDGAGATTTVTVTGAALGDFAEASFSLDLQGITVTAWVSAANTVSVRFQNETGGTLDLGSGTLRARVFKP